MVIATKSRTYEELHESLCGAFRSHDRTRWFLDMLRHEQTRLSDLDKVLLSLPHGGHGQVHSAQDLLSRLSFAERAELENELSDLVIRARTQFPELVEKFKEQFS